MVKVICKSLTVFMSIAGAFWCRAEANDPVVARYHFVGTAHLTANSYDDARKILNLPSSVEYRELVLNRFSGEIAASISPAKGKAGGSAVRPMIDDLLANESTGVFGIPGTGAEEFVVAVHLSKERAAAWVEAIEKLADAPGVVRLQQEGEWTVVSRGASLKSAEDKFLSEIRSHHRPVPELKESILEANVDWPRLSGLPALSSFAFKPAVLQIKVASKGNHLRTEVRARYPRPITWKSQPWKLPTETILDPLVSFTAGQNVAAFMNPTQWAERIGENPFTNQFFIWANLNVPFETSVLFPMKNAQRYLQSIGREVPSRVNSELAKGYNGELKWLEQTNELVWHGVPILVPFVKPIREKAGEFLLAGTFALAPRGPAAPPELWAQFKGRSDLVYYDWEISGPRMLQWRMLCPLLPIFPAPRSVERSIHADTNAATNHTPRAVVDRWVNDLTTALTPTTNHVSNCNVITEVTRNSASDYTVVRSSQLGFTAIEMLLLSHWLADVPLPEVPRPGSPYPNMPQHQPATKKPVK